MPACEGQTRVHRTRVPSCVAPITAYEGPDITGTRSKYWSKSNYWSNQSTGQVSCARHMRLPRPARDPTPHRATAAQPLSRGGCISRGACPLAVGTKPPAIKAQFTDAINTLCIKIRFFRYSQAHQTLPLSRLDPPGPSDSLPTGLGTVGAGSGLMALVLQKHGVLAIVAASDPNRTSSAMSPILATPFPQSLQSRSMQLGSLLLSRTHAATRRIVHAS